MVSEAEYDKNQQSWLESLLNPPELKGRKPEEFGAIGGASAIAGATGLIKGRLIGTAIAGTIGAFLAASAGIPQNIIGKEFNKWASENDIDVGNLRLNAQIALFTTPVINPKTADLEFLDNDATRLRKRMAEAGIPKSLIDLQMIQHLQVRQANERFIKQFESGLIGQSGLSLEEQAFAGETPIETLARLQKEQLATQKQTESEIAQFQADRDFLVDEFRRATGLPADENIVSQFAGEFSPNPEIKGLARELLTILRRKPAEKKRREEQSLLTAQKKEGEKLFTPAPQQDLLGGQLFTPAPPGSLQTFTPLPQEDLEKALAKIRQETQQEIP